MKRKLKRRGRERIDYENLFGWHLQTAEIYFEREFKFHPTRKWRADFKIEGWSLLVEIEGGTWVGGRHTRPLGFQNDIVKYNEMMLAGYRLLRGTPADVTSGRLLAWVKRGIGR